MARLAPLAPHPHRWQIQIMAAVAGVSAEPLSRRPPGNWRAGVIGEHLYLTYGGTAKGFAGVTAAGQPLATDQTWRQRGRRLIMVALASMPSGRETPPVARARGLPAEKPLGKIGRKSPDGFAPTKTWARAADCWTILSSDRIRRHKGESFIWRTAGIRSNRFEGGERRRSKSSSNGETNRAPEDHLGAPIRVVGCFYCWLGGVVWTGSPGSGAEAGMPALRASSC